MLSGRTQEDEGTDGTLLNRLRFATLTKATPWGSVGEAGWVPMMDMREKWPCMAAAAAVVPGMLCELAMAWRAFAEERDMSTTDAAWAGGTCGTDSDERAQGRGAKAQAGGDGRRERLSWCGEGRGRQRRQERCRRRL